jgi:hypothetical protein
MAGTLTISTLSDGTNSTSATNPIQGSARAWVNFDGYTGATTTIKGSFNVSSVTYNSTGDYTINFTTAMSNTNYTFAGVCAYGQGNTVASGRYISPYVGTGTYPFGMATTSLRFCTVYSYNAGNQGAQMVNVIVFGNQ